MEDDDTQSAEITDATGTSPIMGDSFPVFPRHEKSAEDAETAASGFISATYESSRGTRCYPLRDHRPPIRYPE